MEFRGAGEARVTPEVAEAIAQAEGGGDQALEPDREHRPILAVPGMREALADTDAPVVAVSPLVGGRSFEDRPGVPVLG